MVKNRHTHTGGILELAFTPPAGTPAGVEVMSLAQLRSRAGRATLAVPRRPAFHHLLTLTTGTLWHTVDFTGYALHPGTWLWVRPGQVQQWGDLNAAEGTLVLFEQDFLDTATAATARLDDPHAPVVHEPTGGDRDALTDALDHLTRAFTTPRQLPPEIHLAVLRHLLAALVLHLAHLGTPSGSPAPEPSETFLRFRDAVEHGFTRTHRLEDYADSLGYSARTLSRATQAATGVNAKEFIDRRVILEAKRLLAHSDHTAAQIAARLGFTSPTNFTKYFHHRTGTTPTAHRITLRGSDTANRPRKAEEIDSHERCGPDLLP